MALLSALMVKIGADSSGLRKELKTTKREIDRTFSKDPAAGFGNAISGTTASVGNLISKFNTAAAIVGGGFGLTALISSAVTAGANVKLLSEKMNISTAEASMFSKTVRLAGGDMDTAAAAMMRLDKTITGTGEASQKTQAVLDAVGVSLTDQNGKILPLNQQLNNLATGFRRANEAGYGQEFLMNTLGVRGMALTQTLLKYNEAAEDAARIKGIGLDVDQMANINRQLQVTQAQLGQLTMAGGALLAPIVGELLPGITEGLAETAQFISRNKEEIVSLGTTLVELTVTWKVLQAISRAVDWAGSFRTAAVEVQALTKAQEASITRRLNMVKAAQKKEEQAMAKEVASRKITEAEKEKIINESCIRIQMKYAETAARIEASMRAAYAKMSADARLSAAGQVQAIAATGTAAQAAGTKMVAASTMATGAVGSLTKSVWALVGGWYAVAAAIAFAFEKLVEFKQEKSKEISGDLYVGNQHYRRASDGSFYRQTINPEAEDAFDTYNETKVTDEWELAGVREAYRKKHPAAASAPAGKGTDLEKIKGAFTGLGSGGSGSGGSGKGKDPEKEELENRKKLQQALEKEYSEKKTINEAMRESGKLQTAYMTAAEKAVYNIEAEHEKAVEKVRERWLEFETAYIGMSDAERAQMVMNLQEQGAAFEIMENGRLSLVKQTAADIAALEKQHQDEIASYYRECKGIQEDIEEAYRQGSMEKLQAALSNENTAMLNAYNTKKSIMERYYENWLETHKTTSEMVADIILDSQDTFETFFKDVLSGQKSFGDAFRDLLNGLLNDIVSSISKMMASVIVNKFISSFFGGMFGFSDGGLVKGYAAGGAIYGPGTSTSDSIPAMLSAGEYVVKADAVRRIGVPALDAINSGAFAKYAGGGSVMASSGQPSVKGGVNVSIHLTNESGQQLQAEQTGSSFNGEEYVIGVVLKAVSTNQGGLRSMIKGVATT